jgi:hypothetical protein
MRQTLTARVVLGTSLALTLAIFACTPSTAPPPTPTDTDGDGLSDVDEVTIYGTSPVLADTDGDGLSDGTEVIKLAFDRANNPYRFNPRIADVPVEAIRFVGPPDVTIQITETNGESVTFETQRAVTTTVSSSTTTANSQSQTDTQSTTDTASRDVSVTAPLVQAVAARTDVFAVSDAGADAADAADGTTSDNGSGATVTTSEGSSSSVNPSTSFSTTFAFSDQETTENAQTLSETRSFSQSHDVAASSAVLVVAAVLENQGHVAFRVTNIELTAVITFGPDNVVPLGNLTIDTPITTYQPFSLAPHEETGPINFDRTGLTLEQASRILGAASGITISTAFVELSDSRGVPFAFDFDEIGAKTAAVYIDYSGERPTERYYVATNLDPAHPGITVAKALDEILAIPFESDEHGLTSVRDLGTPDGGSGGWIVKHYHDNGLDLEELPHPRGSPLAPTDFKSIQLRAGDVLRLTYE